MKKTPIILTAALLAVCIAVGLTMVFLRGGNVVTVETKDGDTAVNVVYNRATKDFELKCFKSGELIYTRSGNAGDPSTITTQTASDYNPNSIYDWMFGYSCSYDTDSDGGDFLWQLTYPNGDEESIYFYASPDTPEQYYAVKFTEELMKVREISNDALMLAPRESLRVLAALFGDPNIDGELINHTARELGVESEAVELIGRAYASVLNANMWYDFILDLTA